LSSTELNKSRHLLSLSIDQLADCVMRLREKKFRVKQLYDWLHAKRVFSFDEMRNLSKPFRETLMKHYILRTFQQAEHYVSADELTEKWLWHTPLHDEDFELVFPDGVQTDTQPFQAKKISVGHIEAVLIREIRQTRRTVCISCSIGCPIGCVFCASGQHGIDRNLTQGEILEQVYRVDAACRQRTPDCGVTNVVFMGMGEPLLNYDEVIAAARIMADEDGMNLSGRHITISTSGVVPGILRLSEEHTNFRLALSLHAPNQALRETLIPTAKKWKLPELIDALKTFSRTSSRDITIEYCMVDHVNDELSHADELCKLLRGIPCKINLIPYNPVSEYPKHPSSPQRVKAFGSALEKRGLPYTVRKEKGQDINAACGQLRAAQKNEKH